MPHVSSFCISYGLVTEVDVEIKVMAAEAVVCGAETMAGIEGLLWTKTRAFRSSAGNTAAGFINAPVVRTHWVLERACGSR